MATRAKTPYSDKLNAFAESMEKVQEAQANAKQTKALSSVISRLRDIVEQSGEIQTTLTNIADGADVDVDLTSDNLGKWLESLNVDMTANLTEADKQAKLFISLKENEMLEEADLPMVDHLLETYNTVKTFNVRASGKKADSEGTSKVDFPFAIDAICPDGWIWHEGGRSGQGSRFNSMRHFVRLHLEREIGDGYLKGNNEWLTEWKDAKAALDSGADEADIPTFGVTLKKVA